jgi:hypothetical protein
MKAILKREWGYILMILGLVILTFMQVSTFRFGFFSAYDDSYLRKGAIKAKIPYITTMAAAKAAAEGIGHVNRKQSAYVHSLQEWHEMIK